MMKLAGAIFVSVIAIPAGAAELDTYTNARYGYAISYPRNLLRPLPVSDSGDGRIFKAKTGTAEFRVFSNGFDDPEEIANLAEEECPNRKASYRVVKPALVVVSCETAKGNILYGKTLVRDGMATTMTADYPKSESQIWKPVVSAMSKTMTAASDPERSAAATARP